MKTFIVRIGMALDCILAVGYSMLFQRLTSCSAMHYIAFMEDQLTVRFPRELGKQLKAAAARMQRKPSEVVRMAVAEFLQMEDQSVEQPANRIKHLIGSVESGIPDLAMRHREYVLKKLKRGR
jgi:predicted DNA-binding protein